MNKAKSERDAQYRKFAAHRDSCQMCKYTRNVAEVLCSEGVALYDVWLTMVEEVRQLIRVGR